MQQPAATLPLLDQIKAERITVLGILANVESDIARLKSFDQKLMTPEKARRHNKNISDAIGAKFRATYRLQELKDLIKAESRRLHAAQHAAFIAEKARQQAEEKASQP